MDLILWRHAEAEDGHDDLARQLTTKGQQQACSSGAWLAAQLPPHYRVWASVAARSQQTAAHLPPDFEIIPALNPDAQAPALADLLRRLAPDATLVWVGHQPWIGQLCAWLLNGDGRPAAYWSVKKSGFWWFELWFDAEGQVQAKLKAVLTPAVLKSPNTKK